MDKKAILLIVFSIVFLSIAMRFQVKSNTFKNHVHCCSEESCGTEDKDHHSSSSPTLLETSPVLKWSDISEKSSDAVGQLFVYRNIFSWTEPFKSPEQRSCSGSCFFITDSGLMLTNAHCVDQAVGIYVQLPHFGKHRFEAQLVAICPERDLALLQLKNSCLEAIKKDLGEIPFLHLGDSETVRRADEIMTLGFPLGQEWLKSTTGVVSGVQQFGGQSLIQISAAINPGNSGGPALDQYGEVIGICSCGINQNGVQNVGYVIPSKEVSIFLDHFEKIRKNDSSESLLIRIPIAGIIYHGSPITLVEYLGNPQPGGIYVVEVVEGSIAQECGISPGDMLYGIDEYVIDRFGDVQVPWSKDKISLHSYISQLKVDQTISFLVYRKGKKIDIKTKWRVAQQLPIRFMYPSHENIPYLICGGMVIMPLTLNHIQLFLSSGSDDLIDYTRITNQTKPALVIAHIFPNSVAQHARMLSPGMIISEVNDVPVSTIAECSQALSKSSSSKYITIKMKNGEFFVSKIEHIFEDEKKLSLMYNYKINPIIELLKKDFEQTK